jgi:hypothetical protein
METEIHEAPTAVGPPKVIKRCANRKTSDR